MQVRHTDNVLSFLGPWDNYRSDFTPLPQVRWGYIIVVSLCRLVIIRCLLLPDHGADASTFVLSVRTTCGASHSSASGKL